MKKCLKFQAFKKKFEGKNFSSDDILKEFVDAYDSKIEEEKSERNTKIKKFLANQEKNIPKILKAHLMLINLLLERNLSI